MPFPTAVDAIVDAPPVTAATRISSSQVLGPQRVVVGPLLFNVLSDLYSASSTVAAKVTAAVADANFGNGNGLVVIPPLASGMVPPAAPTVTVQGAAGTTTYSYFVIAINAAGDVAVSQTTTITNGNATLNVTNFNAVSWGSVTGATSYKLVRLVVGGTEGVVATQAGTSFNDQGGTVAAFAYPSTGLSALSTSVTTLDLRYQPTNAVAGVTRSDVANGAVAPGVKFARAFGTGAENATVLGVTALAVGGVGSTAGPDGETVALYVESSRTGGTRSLWAANFLLTSNGSPSASVTNVGLEVDVTNSSGVNATGPTPYDGVSAICGGGNANARYGFFVANGAGNNRFFDGVHVGANCVNSGITIDAQGGTVFGLVCNAPAIFQGHILAGNASGSTTLGALQTGISSQSIAGNDTRGQVSLTTTGAAPGAGATVAIVNFANAYVSAPNVIVQAGFNNLFSWSSNATGGFNIVTTGALANTTTYGISYFALG